jgi:hypothetical protein
MIQKVLKLLFVICLFGFQNIQAQTTARGTQYRSFQLQ